MFYDAESVIRLHIRVGCVQHMSNMLTFLVSSHLAMHRCFVDVIHIRLIHPRCYDVWINDANNNNDNNYDCSELCWDKNMSAIHARGYLRMTSAV